MTDTRPIVSLALLALGGWLIYLLAPILTPFLISGLLAYLVNPAVRRLERWYLPRPLAVVLVFLLLLLLIIALLFFLIPALQEQIIAFTVKVPTYLDWLQHTALPQVQALLGIDVGLDMAAVRKDLLNHWRDVGNWVSIFFVYITRSGFSVIGWIVNLLLIPVVIFYLLLDWERLLARTLALVPSRQQAWVVRMARETDMVLGGFLRGQLLVMAALATVYAMGLTLVGLDLALPIGLLAGFMSFVPYLGFITGLLVAGIASYMQFHDSLSLLWVAGVFLTGQVLESLWLTPRLVGKRIGLHPVAVIFAIMAGGQLYGFTGILLALPAAAVLKVWLGHLHEFYAGEIIEQAGKKRRTAKRHAS
ncbi:MAG: AI-2E family transporter [Sulfuricaulis sp.]